MVEDFTTSIDELPLAGGDFLGTLESNMSVNFNITSQTPQGALTVDTSTGAIFIANPALFDYEINTVIQATVEAETSEETAISTITININNVDDIEFYLTNSKQSYIDAAANDWVLITEDEYHTLATTLKEVSKIATSDAYFDLNETIFGANAPATWAHDNGVIIPNNSYVFALKYYSFDDNATGAKVKQSDVSVSDGYSDLGNTLPTHDSGAHYFVMKGNSSATSATGYLAIYSPVSIGFKPFSESMYVGEPGDVNSFDNIDLSNSIIMYQGLSTTLKQWD
ncbi:MAG: cadherin repeat domain-containing protein [Algicola sp.]|nr:cadherin repeat domain-containing protein [Algicola sp.]